MEKQKQEKLIVSVGIALIFIVGLITYYRSISISEKSESRKSQSEEISIATITQDELKNLIDSKKSPFIIDIRSEEDYIAAHILDSINISTDSLSNDDNRLPINQKIVIVGKNSSDENVTKAIQNLKAKKASDVVALAGGITGWLNSGSAVITSGDPTLISDREKIKLISKEELLKEIDANDIQIIDARQSNYYEIGHIKNAINIPFEEIEKRRNEIDTNKIIVVYDYNELQGFQTGVRINDIFLITPFVLRGGFKEWNDSKFEVLK